jgi:mono/diheme cytochrome c family protein
MQLQLTMSKFSHKKAQKAHKVKALGAFGACLLLVVCVGCRRDMQDQPKIKPLRGSTFFADGLGSRQPIEGTIPRGFLRDDNPEFYTGKKSGAATATATPAQQQTAGAQNSPQQNSFPDDVVDFPIPVTQKVVERGQSRYEIFCSACHGLTGYGDGMIVRRGFRRAASFNDDRLRQAPVGHFFDAITNGWGAMPSYASQIPVQDRWAIIAYIRALQLSQQNAAAASASPAPSTSPSPTPAAGGHQ